MCRTNEAAKGYIQTVQTEGAKAVEALQKKNASSETYKKKQQDDSQKKQETVTRFLCTRCKTQHCVRNCPAFGKKCHRCGKMNHFKICCRVKEVREVKNDEFTAGGSEPTLMVEGVKKYCSGVNSVSKAWYEDVKLCGSVVKMKLDTGAEVNTIPEKLVRQLKCMNKIVRDTKMLLESWGGYKIKPLGFIDLDCTVKGKRHLISFYVCNNNNQPLLGLNACIQLGLVKRVNNLKTLTEENFLDENKDLFVGTGKFGGVHKILLRKNAIPVNRPPRRVPISIKNKLKLTLNDLEQKGIISKVNRPVEWASNLVIVEKPNGSLRICLDPADINKNIEREYCLMPTMEEITAKLKNKVCYTVLDLKDGFYHVQLDDKSQQICTFSSPFGYYQFNRLPFGLKTAPELFQKLNTNNFGDIEGVSVYIDDLLIAGETEEEHDAILNKVIDRARKLNIKFNQSKVQYRKSQVKYLGHLFSKDGMQPDPDRIKSIIQLKEPKNKKDLQKVLGMFNYFRNFLPNLSEITDPLRNLLKNNVIFSWTELHQNIYDQIKNMLTVAPVLTNFDDKKEITIHTDASKSGLGCCLLQEGRPVSFASRSMTTVEQNYAQIEKEFLAMAFAVKKFHNYIYGKQVTICTDHKPLVSIMNKKIADIISPRLQRIKLKLVRYDIKCEYMPGKFLHVADLLSRNYLNDPVEDDESMFEVVHNIHAIVNISENKKVTFQKETQADPVLNKVKEYCLTEWPNKIHDIDDNSKILKFYHSVRNDLTIVDGIILFQKRLLVPPSLRRSMLNLLHESHFGVNKTLSRAKEALYWPNYDKEIITFIKSCKICESNRSSNAKEPLISHPLPGRPFSKIGSDICEYAKNNYLIIFDYYSKWLDVVPIREKNSIELIKQFKKFFANFGIPDLLIADNMPYSSYSFKKFSDEYGFKITTSSPHYPRSNGFAESGVKIAKSLLKKSCELTTGLMSYRSTKIVGVGLSPAELVFNRNIKTKLPVPQRTLEFNTVDPNNVIKKLHTKQQQTKYYYDRTTKAKPNFVNNQNVTVQKGGKWESAKIVNKCNEPRSYIVKDRKGQLLRRNSIHLRDSLNEYVPIINCDDNDDDKFIDVSKQSVSQRQRRTPSRFKDYILY
ncbi:hypothetical protein Zmor_014792 [Zophobas morio]|uniref:RNA-directed DNA polymerase n=1 Tax=Zophobas morio TaxID=2755281 RepID=A0AA38MGP2_9CUCU|nr:hypothetical protein Zmor_014792 [Zophobas morio]